MGDADLIGSTLGSYTVTGTLGEGGMGVVYVAEHPLMGRKAAVKLLLPELSKNHEVVDRFFNEARAAAKIKHSGIVDILDFGYTDDDAAYIIMELLEGESLTDRLRKGPMPSADVVRLGRQMASALNAAHKADIVHRDLKPDNIFIVPDSEVVGGERIKILDFGIAKLSMDEGGLSKTRTGVIMGSPLYMSPEQCKGAAGVDYRSDIYSLGCVLFHMATNHTPFEGQGVGEVIGKHMYEEAPSAASLQPDIDPQLDELIAVCLRKEPEQRFASMNALKGAFDSLKGSPRQGTAPIVPEESQVRALPVEPKTDSEDAKAAGKGDDRFAKTKMRTTLGASATTADAVFASESGTGKKWVPAVIGLAVVGAAAFLLMNRAGDKAKESAETPRPEVIASGELDKPADPKSDTSAGTGAESDPTKEQGDPAKGGQGDVEKAVEKTAEKTEETPLAEPGLPKNPPNKAVATQVTALEKRFRRCARSLESAVKFEYRFVVDPAGKASGLTTSGAPSAVERCMAKIVAGAKFPQSREGTRVRVPELELKPRKRTRPTNSDAYNPF